MSNGIARLSAAAIAIIAALGLEVQFEASVGQTGSPAGAAWAMLRYFTVLTNLFVLALMMGIAVGSLGLRSTVLTGGATLAIVMVAVVHFTLLSGRLELGGGALLADFLLHKVVPALTLLFWLAFVHKGSLRWKHALVWTIYPLAYLAYAIARAQSDGKHPYPFIDLTRIPLEDALASVAGIALAFIAGGLVLVAADRALGQRRSNG